MGRRCVLNWHKAARKRFTELSYRSVQGVGCVVESCVWIIADVWFWGGLAGRQSGGGVSCACSLILLEVIAETTDMSSDDEADHNHTNIYQ